jgi:hypothetical protein
MVPDEKRRRAERLLRSFVSRLALALACLDCQDSSDLPQVCACI